MRSKSKVRARSGHARTVGDVIRLLEAHAPSGAAESWDNVGLLVGNPTWPTRGAVVTIDLTEESIRTAKAKGCRLIINHHPCIFPKSKGLAKVVGGTGKGGLVFEAIRQGIAVAAYHTNFDRCALEVIDSISRGLGLIPKGRLMDKSQGSLVKLSVAVPRTHLEQVRDAVAQAGAGKIGNYDFCTFSVEGEGTFRGSEDAKPFLGSPGIVEKAHEARLETILPRGMERAVIQAMLQAHPYEEVAYDLYPVEQVPPSRGLVKGLGYGFWGEFSQPRPFSEVLQDVRRLFKVDGFLLTDPGRKAVRRVAFAAGKGSSVTEAAASLGCDLMITGEVGYHEALAVSHYRQNASVAHRSPVVEQVTLPMAVVELGHRESELFFVDTVKDWLSQAGLKAIGLHVRTQKTWST